MNNQTDAIGKSDVSETVTDVQNGQMTITSREKINYVMTFTAKQSAMIYLVDNTADTKINPGIDQDHTRRHRCGL